MSGGALPVFLTGKPTWTVAPPNDQRDRQSAKPVYFVAQPGGGPWPNSQADDGGAIPVRVVADLATAHGSDQGADSSAIPVWDAGGPPSGPPFSDDPRSHNAAVPVWRTN
ncbi:hypothetical protein [Rhodoblastus sp.]|uniref:hypothetical protein n=1 Tax=Rhodoblastus sp. TaxID=1962975 RepID=UPI0025D32F50|nr:hypothetical protein [Rhodoblastus sp.]